MAKIKDKLKGFKQNLPTKTCQSCNRPFSWRKKWKNNWEQVKYCSVKCQRQKT